MMSDTMSERNRDATLDGIHENEIVPMDHEWVLITNASNQQVVLRFARDEFVEAVRLLAEVPDAMTMLTNVDTQERSFFPPGQITNFRTYSNTRHEQMIEDANAAQKAAIEMQRAAQSRNIVVPRSNGKV